MNSFFITGTDTDVGKTYVTAGLAVTLRKMGINVGIMKPFAAGTAQRSGFKSEDVEILSNAAKVDDPESLVNPQFFPIPASPYTAYKKLKIKPKISTVIVTSSRIYSANPTTCDNHSWDIHVFYQAGNIVIFQNGGHQPTHSLHQNQVMKL